MSTPSIQIVQENDWFLSLGQEMYKMTLGILDQKNKEVLPKIIRVIYK